MPAAAPPATPAAVPPMPVKLPSISLGSVPTAPSTPAATAGTEAAAPVAAKVDREAVMGAMRPIQTVLGTWEGKTQKNVGDFKGLDAPTWVWDHKTDRNQPSLVMKSEKNRYFREARLTYVPGVEKYQLTTTDADGHKRVFEGTFTLPVEEYQGDDNRPHKRFKLELTEITPVDVRSSWQVVLNQQDNNRYLFELAEKKGMRFMRFDTLANQRAGTSFAMNDSDYKERTCVISGGLGTTAVTFGGKTYYVCCSGCKAAFDDEPARWVAEFEAKQKMKAVQ